MAGQRTITVKLVKTAKKQGGDKYESDQGFTTYIPQYVSRPNGNELPPVQFIKMTFEVADQVGK